MSVERVKSVLSVDYYTQTLSNGHKVFDFKQFERSGFFMNVLLTERGGFGKTLNMKEQIRKEYMKNGLASIWLANTEPFILSQARKFTKDFEKALVKAELGEEASNFWSSCVIDGSLKTNNYGLYHISTDKDKKPIKKLLIWLLPINKAEEIKGAREQFNYLVYDEFNVKSNVVKDLHIKFDSILHTLEDVVMGKESQIKQIFLFGNNKSLNHELMYKLNIRTIEHEVTEYIVGSMKLINVVSPMTSMQRMEEIDKKNQDNPIYQLSKVMGTHKHSYANESLYDETNFVKHYGHVINDPKHFKPAFTIHHKNKFIQISKNLESNVYHGSIIEPDSIKTIVFAFQSRDIKESVGMNNIYKKQVKKALSRDSLTFEDITTRDILVSSVRY